MYSYDKPILKYPFVVGLEMKRGHEDEPQLPNIFSIIIKTAKKINLIFIFSLKRVKIEPINKFLMKKLINPKTK